MSRPKGFHHSEETKRKMALASQGQRPSEESRKKMSLAHIGKPSPNKGKTKLKERFCAGCSKLLNLRSKNVCCRTCTLSSPEYRQLMSRLKSGINHHMFGLKHSSDTKKLIGLKSKGRCAGDKHPKWKGGITSLNQLERGRFRDQLQKVIFERDGYRCQFCGANRRLQVDHIVPWAKSKELRFDPTNCRTLCEKCHYKVTFGREMPPHIKRWGGAIPKKEAA